MKPPLTRKQLHRHIKADREAIHNRALQDGADSSLTQLHQQGEYWQLWQRYLDYRMRENNSTERHVQEAAEQLRRAYADASDGELMVRQVFRGVDDCIARYYMSRDDWNRANAWELLAYLEEHGMSARRQRLCMAAMIRHLLPQASKHIRGLLEDAVKASESVVFSRSDADRAHLLQVNEAIATRLAQNVNTTQVESENNILDMDRNMLAFAELMTSRYAQSRENMENMCALAEVYPDVPAAGILHSVVPYPGEAVAIEPTWLTSTVCDLARCIHEERAYDSMLLLVDALQDAGCTDAVILNRCGGGGPFVPGEWVLDLLLGQGLGIEDEPTRAAPGQDQVPGPRRG